MIIVSLRQLTKGRYEIQLDTEESFVLYRGELNRFKIREGEALPDSVYNTVMKEILPKRAKLRGLNLLKTRPYTEHQMRSKYIDGGYPAGVIDTAIDYLKNLKVIDDRAYCLNYIGYYSTSRSRKRIFSDLINKGVAKAVIEDAYTEYIDLEGAPDETEQILKLLEKKRYNPEDADYTSRQKIRGFLYGKGYDMDNIIRLT